MSETYKNLIQLPWTLKIEFSYGCNLQCRFCPIGHDRERYAKHKFLDPKTCRKIVEQAVELKNEFRVELTLRGEPTLNPWLLQNLRIIRDVAPRFQISLFTNGITSLKDPSLLVWMLDAGVNFLCIDCYGNSYAKLESIAKASGEELHSFKDVSAYKRHPSGHKKRMILLVPNLTDNAIRVRKVHNMAGNAPTGNEPPLPLAKKCARPFRELAVCYNGDVPICCHDWKCETLLGNINKSTLQEIWFSEKHAMILKQLYAKSRGGIDPCSKCDYSGGYRLGFLKNPSS